MELSGIYPIVPTPFGSDGQLCFESLHRLVDFMVDKGVDGIAALGVMGEGHKLDQDERDAVVKVFKERLPSDRGLVVGVREQVAGAAAVNVMRATDLGADAVLLGPPSGVGDNELMYYYSEACKASQLPIIIHDFPAATGTRMSVELLSKLYKELDTVSYVKLEDPPTGVKMDALNRMAGAGLRVFGALGGAFAFEELDRGAVGIMTGFAFPELLVDIYRRFIGGDRDGAARAFYKIVPLIRFEFQPDIGVSLRKHILVKRGVFSTSEIRSPGTVADPKTLEHLELILDYLGL